MRGTMRGKILQHWHLNYPAKLSKPQVSFRGIPQLVNTKKRYLAYSFTKNEKNVKHKTLFLF